MSDRSNSIAEYKKPCPATQKAHDWRHATDAPGWRVGDVCVRCQVCQLKAIDAEASSRATDRSKS